MCVKCLIDLDLFGFLVLRLVKGLIFIHDDSSCLLVALRLRNQRVKHFEVRGCHVGGRLLGVGGSLEHLVRFF